MSNEDLLKRLVGRSDYFPFRKGDFSIPRPDRVDSAYIRELEKTGYLSVNRVSTVEPEDGEEWTESIEYTLTDKGIVGMGSDYWDKFEAVQQGAEEDDWNADNFS